MSHRPERKAKDCLNCGTIVHGKYCHVCGQENVEPKESFWGMVSHFFNDITHFDGKFFTTLKILLFKPGFLSAEYVRGRRMSYLNPIRMYVFTSAVFFLIFFSMRDSNSQFKITDDGGPLTAAKRDSILREVLEDLQKSSGDSNLLMKKSILSDTTRTITMADLLPYDNNFNVVSTWGYNYRDRKEYDSLQAVWPAGERDGWLKRLWNKRALHLKEKYKKDQKASLSNFSDIMMHQLPYLLFVSLPFFALILKFLYIRRKEFYYTDHGIFSIHHYIISFILLLLIFMWDYLDDISGWAIWDILTVITIITWPVFLFLAMKRFYRQNGFKTFLKFIVLNIMGIIMAILLLVVFFLLSIFQL